MNWKGFGRGLSFPTGGRVPEFSGNENKENHERLQLRITGVPPEIRTEHFPNKSLEASLLH
jgi:hypothetical protein